MTAFRYKITEFESIEEEVVETKGFIVAEGYTEAMEQLVRITTDASGKNQLVDVYIYEIESLNGVLLDDDIQDIYKEEKEKTNEKK